MTWFWFVVGTWTVLSGIGLLAAVRLTEMSIRLRRRTDRETPGGDFATSYLLMGVALGLFFGGLFLVGIGRMREPEVISIATGVASLTLAGLLSAATFYLMKVVGRRFG